MDWKPLVETVAYTLIVVGAMARLASITHKHHLEIWGLAITAGGASGAALEWWWPLLETVYHAETVFAVGVALVAISIMRDGPLARRGFN